MRSITLFLALCVSLVAAEIHPDLIPRVGCSDNPSLCKGNTRCVRMVVIISIKHTNAVSASATPDVYQSMIPALKVKDCYQHVLQHGEEGKRVHVRFARSERIQCRGITMLTSTSFI